MKTIAFDTSNQPLSVALFDDERLIGQLETNQPKNHSVQLLPFMDQLLAQAGWQPVDLEQVIVSQGPGSYTGLRIAVTTAKTLAFTLNIPLVGVSSLALIAANVQEADTIIVPIMDARNDNMYAGAYQWQNDQLVAVFPDQHMNLQKLITSLTALNQPVTLVGDFARFAEQITTAVPNVLTVEDNLPHAANLLALGRKQPVIKEMDLIHQFVPNYLRKSQAEADWAAANPGVSEDGLVEKI